MGIYKYKRAGVKMNKPYSFEDEYELLTPRQISKALKKHLGTVQRWCRDGILPAARIEGQYLIRRADFDEWFRAKMSTSQQVVKTEKDTDSA